MDNMGFSKEDGYSENPSGKISFLFQLQVFGLIDSLLRLHKDIMFFLLYHAEIIYIFEPYSPQRNIDIFGFMSKITSKELKRNRCYELIKEELENDDIKNYSKTYILKQLSNWNVFDPAEKEKNRKQKRTKPLPGYEDAKKRFRG